MSVLQKDLISPTQDCPPPSLPDNRPRPLYPSAFFFCCCFPILTRMEHQHQHEHQHDHTHSHDHATLNQEDPVQSEQLHLIKVITAFAYYKRHSLNHNHRRRRDYLSLSEHHKRLIPDYLDKVNQVDGRIEENMNLIRAIVKSASMFTEDADDEPAEQNSKVEH